MQSARASITTLLTGTGILFLGNGLLMTILPIRAHLEGFSTFAIGTMGAVYYAGFALGCLIGPMIIKKVGHVRCFAGFGALAAAAVLALPLAVEPLAWWGLRILAGLCFALLNTVIESWLNDQSSNEVRGRVLSIYIITVNVVTMAGQLAVNLYSPENNALFILTAMLIALSLVPLALTDTASPKPLATARLEIGKFLRLSPTALIGCVAVGIVEGAFWSLGPVFAQQHAFNVSEVTFFMGAFVLGGTLSQWPLGRYSDTIDRRYVLSGCCLGTVVTGLAMVLVPWPNLFIAYGLAICHGAFMIPLYPLFLAHANDRAPNDQLVQTSSGLLLIYAAGAALGPVLIGTAMNFYGSDALFFAMAVILGAVALYILFRLARRARPEDEERVEFVPVPKTTPSVYTLETDD